LWCRCTHGDRLRELALRPGLEWPPGIRDVLRGLIGYLLAASFYITAVLKPIYPHNIGFFVSSHGLNLANWPARKAAKCSRPITP
jgi:hypothetical protein